MPGSASSEPHKGQPYPCTMRDSLVEWRGCGEFDTKPAGRQISIKSDIYMDVFEYKSYIYIQDIVPPFSISPFSSTSFFYLFPSSGRFVCPETRKSDSAQSIFFPQARLLIDFFLPRITNQCSFEGLILPQNINCHLATYLFFSTSFDNT